ncbi:TauD/TfdA family dioxygenase [Amycolatopsis sp. lyj-346]|uniref:TauD/TfdA family dioxygenase n=1 Tax=Amycolatopsis sp. lyj-346 TaxID=2789289 RepID=UPI00397A4E60
MVGYSPVDGQFGSLGRDAVVDVVERGGTRLLSLEPKSADDPGAWVRRNVDDLRTALRTLGAVMVKNTPVGDDAALAAIAELVGGRTLDYTERSTPRSRVKGKVYTSTEYPADQEIPQHNESAYSVNWPDNLFFYCALAAETGGETPVADSRAVLAALPEDLVERFAAHGVLYTRTYRQGIGLSWQEAFQAEDRADVEKYCADNRIETEWDDDLLRTRQVRPATTTHPLTGERVWFNQAHLFHINNLPAVTRASVLAIYDEEDLPRNAYLGDGSPITDEDFAAIVAAFEAAKIAEPWGHGDLLMIDNLLVSHGRRPYTGDRRVLVSMTKR